VIAPGGGLVAVALTVTPLVPGIAPPHVIVDIAVAVTLAGLNEQEKPMGPFAARETDPVKPFMYVTVIVDVPVLVPAAALTLVGLAVTPKSGVVTVYGIGSVLFVTLGNVWFEPTTVTVYAAVPVLAELAWQFKVEGAEVPAASTTKAGVRLHAKPIPGATLATRLVCPL
jgi:hypothetical protein